MVVGNGITNSYVMMYWPSLGNGGLASWPGWHNREDVDDDGDTRNPGSP